MAKDFRQIVRPRQDSQIPSADKSLVNTALTVNTPNQNGRKSDYRQGHKSAISGTCRPADTQLPSHVRFLCFLPWCRDHRQEWRRNRLPPLRRRASPHWPNVYPRTCAPRQQGSWNASHLILLLDDRRSRHGIHTAEVSRNRALLVHQPRSDHEHVLLRSGREHVGNAGR